MSTSQHVTDIAIVGAGPVGLFAVFEAGMLGMRCRVVDALDAVGGQCVALYPEKPIYDIPGHSRIDAQALIEKLVEQANPFAPFFHLGQQVIGLERSDGGWRLETSAGMVLEARAVIVAAGVGAFGPNRPPLEGIERFEGKSVFYVVARREDFRGKRVVIAGGGDSAVDWALSLAEVAAHVYVVHRRAKFRAAPESVRQLRQRAEAGSIELVIPYQLAAIEGADGALSAVTVRTLDGERRRLDADVMLPFFGLAMNLGPLRDWGLAFDRDHVTVDPATCATSLEGVFAIGDIATYPGKLKLILSGFSEAAMAVHAIHPLVFPDQELHFEYSTIRGIPKVT